MKILLVSPLPPPMGGIATWSVKYFKEFKNRGHDVSIVNIAHKLGRLKSVINKAGYIERIGILFSTIIKVKRELKKNYDIVHINSSAGGGVVRDFMIIKTAQKRKCKIIIHYHCNIADQMQNNRKLITILRLCLKNADQLIVLNAESMEYLKNEGYSSIIVPNSVAENSIISRKVISECIEKVAFTGRISSSKGCNELFEFARGHKDINFYLAGLVDRTFVKDNPNPDNVKLLGVLDHDKIVTLLDGSDVFLFLSHTEGFSLSLLEAMSRGLPCIVSNVGANTDMIENKGGCIVEYSDLKQIDNAFKIMMDKNTRTSMSCWNIEKVRNYYSDDAIYNSLEQIYKETLDKCY